MKRYSKLFAFALAAFFVSIVPTFAKEMTIEELETELGSEVDSFYLIGNYVFTNKNPLTTSDTMLAARSIKLSDEAQREALIKGKKAYDEMTIYYAEKTGDDTWSDLTKVLGKTELEEDAKTNVEYIDYEFVKLDAEVSGLLDTAHTDKIKQLVTGWNGNDTTLKLDGGKLTGLVKYTPDAKFSSIPEENTGYYFALEISVKDATEATTLKTITRTGTERVIPWSAWDDTSSADKKIAMLVAVSPEDTDKEFTVIVDLDGEGETYGPTEYTIDYSEVIFEKITKAAVVKTTPEQEKEFEEDFGYVPNGEVTVDDGSTKHADDSLPVYKYTGEITKQALKPESGYTVLEAGYFTFLVKPETVIPGKTTVTIEPASNKGEGKKNIILGEDDVDGILLIRQITETKEFKVTVDIDGAAGTEYLPYSFYINYEDITVMDAVHTTTPQEMAPAAKAGIESSFHYFAKPGTTLTYTQIGNVIKFSGDIVKNEDVTGMGAKTSGYYLAFSMKFDEKYENITIQMPGSKELTTYVNFDTETEIGMLVTVYPLSGRKDNIVIDLDGTGSAYEPYVVTIDYTEVNFMDESIGTKIEKLPETSKEGFQNWMGSNYQYTDSFEFTLKDEVIKVTGEAKKHPDIQKYLKNNTDYYLVYVLKFDQKYEDIKITIEGRENPITQSDFDGGESGDGKILTLVKPIKEEDVNKTIKLTIDYDGDKNKYTPIDYSIDYSDIQFEK